jgi:hypothetical protein
MNKELDMLLDVLERLVKIREGISVPVPVRDNMGYTPSPVIPMHAQNIDNVIINVTMQLQSMLQPRIAQ